MEYEIGLFFQAGYCMIIEEVLEITAGQRTMSGQNYFFLVKTLNDWMFSLVVYISKKNVIQS